MSLGTEFARDFCAGIGPLQLGVVLVAIYILILYDVYGIEVILDNQIHNAVNTFCIVICDDPFKNINKTYFSLVK